MKVCVEPHEGLSRAMSRVARALARYAPDGVEIVRQRGAADLIVLHAVGYPETVVAAEAVRRAGRRYALIQYCLRTTQQPHASAWLALWQQAELVWSYYDLPALLATEGAPQPFAFYDAPLGVDSTVFAMADLPRAYTVLTSGYVPESESVLEAMAAAARLGGRVVHLGPGDERYRAHVTSVLGVSDQHLAEIYNRCCYVSGLRRVEGFELPAAEGLLCGARPVLFDAPHYRRWYEPWGVFVPECEGDALIDALAAVFADQRPVTVEERAAAARRFAWEEIARGFWRRLGLGQHATRAPARARRRLLWIGDAGVATGFARATHYTLEAVRHDWDVHVLGINYDGDPHPYPYPIYPAVNGGDVFGYGRTAPLVERLRPDVVVVQQDVWNVPRYVQSCGNTPVVASMPVDGQNCRGRALNGLAHAVFWTDFGLREARAGGYVGPATVIPLGVDLDIYRQRDQREARRALGLPPQCLDGFIVGNVNRNQPRKRLDLTIAYFAEWVKRAGIDNAYLYLHVAPTGEASCDVVQLMSYFGLANRLICVEPDFRHGDPEELVAQTYAAFDVLITTTQGEGWGLPVLEAMACGVPTIVPQWAALGEWATAALQVPCTSVLCTPDGINVIGGIADRARFIEALDRVYRDAALRDQMRRDGLALAQRPAYRWAAIGRAFGEVLEHAWAQKGLAPAMALS